RCAYFCDVASACNRRAPGSGCDALGGENRLHAILGWSERCIATHPSDFCVPLAALDAIVEIEGSGGRREMALESLHLLPGETPWRARAGETQLAGTRPDAAVFRRAAMAALADARPSGDNAFKIELARRIVARTLALAAAGTPERAPALPASPFAPIPGGFA